MKNGYKIHWTRNALEELSDTIEYLQRNFTDKEITRLALKIEETLQLISQNPELFQKSEIKNIRRVVILKFNTMYYRIENDNVEILSFFSNRQNPKERKI
ncbi:MAG: type II toxin-antitoxin system RelE/ParE family toxin [Weeksellaceae bacterium]